MRKEGDPTFFDRIYEFDKIYRREEWGVEDLEGQPLVARASCP